MKNVFFILLALLFVNTSLVAQTLLTELNKDYTNQSQLPSTYIIGKESVTLKTGFSASAAAGQGFRLRVLKQDEYYAGQYDNTKNYIITKVFRKAMTSSSGVSSKQDVAEQVQYFDGLGRPDQVVTRYASPKGHDMVQHIAYDNFGRQPKQYLPYVSNFNLGTKVASPEPKIDAFYLQGGTLATTNTYFSESVFDNSPLNRVIEQSAPGDAWKIGSSLDLEGRSNGKTIKAVLRTNTTNEVRLWSITGNAPVSYSYYTPNQLMVTVTKDENWVSGDGNLNTVAEFKDKLGRVVLKQTYVTDNTVQKLSTYYVYDDFGNLRFVIPPKAAKIGGSLTPTQVKELCFSYTYDDRNRMVSKIVPGAKVVYMVYDDWDRLVLTQDGNQRADEDWLFTKYDVLNRPIITGKVHISGSTSTSQLTSLRTTVQNSSGRYETLASGSDTYSSTSSYPTSSNTTINTVTYYDNYSFLLASAWLSSYDFNASHGGFSLVKATGVKGQVTGSKTRILNDPNPVGGNDRMLKSVTYYDSKYRAIQAVSENHLGGIDKTSNTYDFTGNILESYQEHTSSIDQVAINNKMEYDHTGRLLTVIETIDSNAPVIAVSNKYNELGELIEKNLHSTNNGSSFLQSVDYRYNIRGWLTSINNSKLNNSGTNNDTNDLFGMELQYNTGVTVNGHAIAPQYNGNITSIKWNTDNMEDAKKEQIYGYSYDELNRITSAYSASANGANWTNDPGNFDMQIGNGITSGYDENGNILNLTRYGLIDNTRTKIDDLNYTYENSSLSNQLKQVDDGVTSYMQGIGFNENMPGVATDYTYDANGNMEVDHNKGLDITYNYLNLPNIVDVATKGKIEYVYDASGIKLAQIVKATNGTTIEKQRTDYIGGIQYQTGKTEPIKLSSIATGEGRIIKSEDGGYQQEYFLKDHLGNTRVTFGYLKDSEAYLATLEDNSYNNEKGHFLNLGNTRVSSSNHTKATVEEPFPEFSKQVDVGQTGPAMVLSVVSGDKVSMQTWVSYTGTATNNINGMVSALSTVFSGSLVIPGSETVASVTSSFEGLATSAIASGSNSSEVTLNYIFIPDTGTGLFGVANLSAGDDTGYYKKLEFAYKFVVPANGTMYIYTMNESAGATTYFDDMLIIHEKNTSSLQVTQSADYYPFGLTFNDYQREDKLENKYLYNGKEEQDDYDLGWVDYGARMYMPEIGKWTSIDILAEKYYDFSPYSYVGNMPILAIDPDGMQIIVLGSDAYKRQVLLYLFNLALNSEKGAELVNKAFSSRRQFVIAEIAGDSKIDKYKDYDVLNFDLKKAEGEYDASNGSEGKSLIYTGETKLAHELGHFVNASSNKGFLLDNDGYATRIRASEVKAVEEENIVRKELGLPERTHYGGMKVYGKKIAQSKYEGYYELTSKNNYANSNQTEKRVKRNSWTQNLTIEQVKRTTYQFNGRYIEKYLINRPPSKQTILHDKKK